MATLRDRSAPHLPRWSPQTRQVALALASLLVLFLAGLIVAYYALGLEVRDWTPTSLEGGLPWVR